MAKDGGGDDRKHGKFHPHAACNSDDLAVPDVASNRGGGGMASGDHSTSRAKVTPKSLSESAKHMFRNMLSPRSKHQHHHNHHGQTPSSRSAVKHDQSHKHAKSNGPTKSHHTSKSSASRRRQMKQVQKNSSTSKLASTPLRKTNIAIGMEESTLNHEADGASNNAHRKTCCLHFPSSRSHKNNHVDNFIAQHHRDLVHNSLQFFSTSPSSSPSSSSSSSSSPGRDFLDSETDRVIYVNQREMAHATQSQTEWIVTHKATTCHILSVRSHVKSAVDTQHDSNGTSVPTDGTVLATTNGSGSSSKSPAATPSTYTSVPLPLSTLTHVDAPKYNHCIRGIFEHHYQYYCRELRTKRPPTIYFDICIVGGFDDPKGKSRPLSMWLLQYLADLATEYKDSISCRLRHCLVSSSNSTSASGGPLVRGMAIDTRTGNVVRVNRVAQSLIGPLSILRQARLWSSPSAHPGAHWVDGIDPTQLLSIIHDESSRTIKLSPFWFELDPDLQWLLEIETDEELIKCTSTSPDHEDNVTEFCGTVRRTLMWMNDNNPNEVFGSRLSHSLLFQRIRDPSSSSSNRWDAIAIDHDR
eukprot:CAMPEP_0119553630 /NCGR_PEP_ID=MMETSP1352-20130426/6336_1 /TAXON_ID=265584 /ORGANISM="Stauroneis constricta, Strain CCMP1120" /LENGTH=581 /DNA_ID=CAMNT_0007600075 /DNA_START=209 /DNA_END=1954 /DNA_ORIENTATION=-